MSIQPLFTHASDHFGTSHNGFNKDAMHVIADAVGALASYLFSYSSGVDKPISTEKSTSTLNTPTPSSGSSVVDEYELEEEPPQMNGVVSTTHQIRSIIRSSQSSQLIDQWPYIYTRLLQIQRERTSGIEPVFGDGSPPKID